MEKENIKEMNRLIIIGNGFDLAHGMETTYKDFILDYLNSFMSDGNFICPYGLINRNSDRTSPYKYTELDIVYKEMIRNHIIDKNAISHFLKELLNKQKDQDWVDIEKIYYTNLIAGINKYGFDNINVLNKDLDKIKKLLHDYLKSIKNPPVLVKINDLPHQKFDIYLQEKYQYLEDLFPKVTLFLNFNYTDTIKEYYNSYARDKQLINIHGQLDDTKNPIIFGYGDEMDDNYKLIEEKNDNEYLKNFKTFQYLKTSNYQNLERFVESLPFEVFVIGHSCGLSDRVLLNYVFEHENCKSIKIFHHKDQDNYLNTVMDISRHFKDKQLVRSKVVPFDRSEPCPQWNDE